MTTTQDLTRLYERQVKLALELLDDADSAYPELANQIRQFVPAMITTALGVPISPTKLDELLDVQHRRDNGEDAADIKFWWDRYDELLSAIIRPAIRVAS